MNTNQEELSEEREESRDTFLTLLSLFFTHSDYVSDMREAGKKKMNSPNNAQQENLQQSGHDAALSSTIRKCYHW